MLERIEDKEAGHCEGMTECWEIELWHDAALRAPTVEEGEASARSCPAQSSFRSICTSQYFQTGSLLCCHSRRWNFVKHRNIRSQASASLHLSNELQGGPACCSDQLINLKMSVSCGSQSTHRLHYCAAPPVHCRQHTPQLRRRQHLHVRACQGSTPAQRPLSSGSGSDELQSQILEGPSSSRQGGAASPAHPADQAAAPAQHTRRQAVRALAGDCLLPHEHTMHVP